MVCNIIMAQKKNHHRHTGAVSGDLYNILHLYFGSKVTSSEGPTLQWRRRTWWYTAAHTLFVEFLWFFFFFCPPQKGEEVDNHRRKGEFACITTCQHEERIWRNMEDNPKTKSKKIILNTIINM